MLVIDEPLGVRQTDFRRSDVKDDVALREILDVGVFVRCDEDVAFACVGHSAMVCSARAARKQPGDLQRDLRADDPKSISVFANRS